MGTVKITGTWVLVSMLQGGEERGPSVARVRDHVIRAVELWCGAEPRVRTGHVSVDIIDKIDTVDIRYCPVDTCRPRPRGRSWTRETRGPPAERSHRRSRQPIW